MKSPVKKAAAVVLSIGIAGLIGSATVAQPVQFYQPHPRSTISTEGTLSIEELERRVSREGLQVTKMEIRDLLLKVDGFDSEYRKVKLHIDRRTGEVLSREYKLGKHGPYGKHGRHLPFYGQPKR